MRLRQPEGLAGGQALVSQFEPGRRWLLQGARTYGQSEGGASRCRRRPSSAAHTGTGPVTQPVVPGWINNPNLDDESGQRRVFRRRLQRKIIYLYAVNQPTWDSAQVIVSDSEGYRGWSSHVSYALSGVVLGG